MKTLSCLVRLSLALTFSAALRAEISAQTWLETYYLTPEPDGVSRAINELSRTGYFDRHDNIAIAIGFFGTLFAQHPERVEDWLQKVGPLPPAHQRLVASALWQASHPQAEMLLRVLARKSPVRVAVESLASIPSQRILDTPVRSPSSMRLQWGAFLASGDERHILGILEGFGLNEPALSSAARMALAQNAAAHPRVLEICQAQLDRQPEEIRSELRAALSHVPSPAPRS